MRFSLFLIFLSIWGFAFSQALPPEQHGGSTKKTINLRENPIPKYDFVKFNPDFQTTAPAKRTCASVQVEEKRKAFVRGESNNNFEKWMRRTIEDDPLIAKSGEIFTIPVVIHVIYSNVVENISQAQIMSQIEALNADYRHVNKDTSQTLPRFRKVAADMGIEFKLATRDPQGRPTDGIDRISMAGAPFSEKYINEVIKPNTIWNTSEYLNLWVCYIDNNVLGFSQFPESSGLDGIPADIGTVFTDGVVVTYTAFGTIGTVSPPFDKGRTLTHEVGHWLGLRHIWGDGIGECSADDYCEDTPLTKGPNFGCKMGAKGCKDTAMVENFMDYTDDKCMSIFSLDQKKRIWSVLENSPRRKELRGSKAAEPLKIPPAPVFISDISVGSQSLTVKFKDVTVGKNRNRKWTFVGGNPASSTDINPVVFYNKPGKYPVSLTLTNDFGTNTETIEEYVIVYGKGEKLPLICDFEGDNKHKNVHIQAAPWNDSWKFANSLGGYGKSAGAIWINNYINNRPGARSYFTLPSLDFSTGVQTQLSFDIAYRFFNEKYSDTLGIYLSIDDGRSFQAIYYKTGKSLAANASHKDLYNPAPEDWRTEVIDLGRYDGNVRVQIAFVCINGYGNNLYLDNIKLSSTPLPLPVVDFDADRYEVCVNEPIGFTDNTSFKPTKWLWSFPGAVHPSDTARNPLVSYRTPGLYEVSLTATNASGESVLTKKDFIKVKAIPDISFSAIPESVCPGAIVNIKSSGGAYYLWIYGDRESNEAEIVDTLFFSKSYEVASLGSNGCSFAKQFTIKVKDEQEISIVPPVTKVCDGQMATIVAGGGKDYLWKNASGATVSNTNVLSIRATSSMKYNLSVKTVSGCSFSKIVPIYVERKPVINIQSSATQICAGGSIQLKASGATSYIWNGVAEGRVWNVSPSKTSMYSVVGTNEAGCKDTAMMAIQVNPLPLLTSTPTHPSICEGASVTLRGTGAQSYFWQSQDGNESSGSFVFTVSPMVSQNYYLIGSSERGCKDTLTIPIEVYPMQKARIEAREYAVCKNEPITVSLAYGKNIQWKNLSTQAVSSTERLTITPTQTTNISVSGLDNKGCPLLPDTITIHTLQGNKPIAAFSYVKNEVLCAGQSVQFKDSSNYARKYFWEFEGGTPVFSTDENPIVVYKKGGTFRVKLIVEGCNQSDTFLRENAIVIQDMPRMQLSSDKPYLCFGESVGLTAHVVGAERFEWSPNFGLDQTEGSSVIASPTDSTIYTVKATMPNGCTMAKSILLPVKKSGMSLNIEPENPTVCQGESITLKAINGTKHYWSSIENDLSKSGTSITITPRKSGKYQLVASDSLGCSMRKEVQVSVFRRPRLTLDPPVALLCKGGQVMIEAFGAGTYSWFPGTGLSATIGKRVTAFPTSSQSYLVLGTDENGCKDTASVMVGVSETPPVQLKAERTSLCKGMATQITATGASEYEWYPFSNLNTNKGNQVIANPGSEITYVVHATAEDGCTSKGSITIHVNEMPAIPIKPESAIICKGETIHLEAFAPFNSRWGVGVPIKDIAAKKVSVKPQETSIYQINGWDENGCPRTGEITVVVHTAQKVNIVAAQTAVCEGGTLSLQAKGSNQYEWLAAPNLSVMAAGKAVISPQKNTLYTVVGTDEHGCKDTASIAINTQSIQPQIDVSLVEIDLAKDMGLVRFTDKTLDATQWLWDFGDGGKSDLQQAKHVYTKSGIYNVRLTVSNGICSKTLSRQIEIKNSSDIKMVQRIGALAVKTQANGTVSVSFQSEKEMAFILSIINVAKEELLSGRIHTNKGRYEQEIDMSSFGKGKYILQIQDEKETLSYPFEWQ